MPRIFDSRDSVMREKIPRSLPQATSEAQIIEARVASFSVAANAAPSSIWIARGTAVSAPAAQSNANASPLAGKLFAVKDNIDVAGYSTTAACPAFAFRPERSANVVQRLLDAGATAVGKTNLDQFACGLVGTRSPYGAVPNAFDARYISGGSSSGSAVAVALGLVDFALGTDTAGSGRVPAGLNNIVGLKPSRGLLSMRGILPACAHLDCPAIFARTVAEAVDVFEAAAGFDSEDPYSRRLALDRRPFPQAFRFGVPAAGQLRFFGDQLSAVAFDHACGLLANLGGSRRETNFEPFTQAATALYEDAWVAERYAAIRDFMDVASEEMDPVVRDIIARGRSYGAADLFDAMRRMASFRQTAEALWSDFDVLVVPTAPTIYTLEEVAADPVGTNRRMGYYTNAVNLLDLAAIAVPSSIRADGLPFGITLIGPAGSELRLAALAARYHAATGLSLGTTSEPVPAAPQVSTLSNSAASGLSIKPATATARIAVMGAHLSGLPLNGELLEHGARLVVTTRTAPMYHFFALANTSPPKPGLLRVGPDRGAAIDVEVWEMPLDRFGAFVQLVPGPLCIGTLRLEDGSAVQGFLCESSAVQDATDITGYGGWRAWLEEQAKPARREGVAAT
ncbi:MAG: atzF [Herminiimonas sp.]|nr:atzF [Herminiimonas sp.]